MILRQASEGRAVTRTRQHGVGGDKSKSTVESLDKWVKELMIAGDWGTIKISFLTK